MIEMQNMLMSMSGQKESAADPLKDSSRKEVACMVETLKDVDEEKVDQAVEKAESEVTVVVRQQEEMFENVFKMIGNPEAVKEQMATMMKQVEADPELKAKMAEMKKM